MYFYFLGSPTGDSQNGASSVNFTEHGFLPDRGCSQPIFHRWSKQESLERGSGDRCSLEDSKIHRKKKKEKAQTDRQWSTFNSWAAPLLSLTQINSVSLSSARSFLSAKLLRTSNLLFIWRFQLEISFIKLMWAIIYPSHLDFTHLSFTFV